MKIAGRRIHIAGSTGRTWDHTKIRYGHEVIRTLVERLALAGARFVVQFGKEVHADDAPDSKAPAIFFDWTVAEVLGRLLNDGRVAANSDDGHLIACVKTEKTEEQIPAERRALWEQFLQADALQIIGTPPGSFSGAVRRQMQAPLGDVLFCLSGGEGVEHLAQQYALQSKPVIPFDLNLGSSSNDGSGGGAMLSRKMNEHPERFARLSQPERAGGLLTRLSTRDAKRPVADVVQAAFDLLDALASPTVFYVRVLNRDLPCFPDVERYFREVVDPIVIARGFEPYEMGIVENSNAWLNAQIFEAIRQAAAAIVDLTGVRPNCLIELGYGHGLGKKVLATARHDTVLPFDIDASDYRKWNLAHGPETLINELQDYWRRNIHRPPIALPPRLL